MKRKRKPAMKVVMGKDDCYAAVAAAAVATQLVEQYLKVIQFVNKRAGEIGFAAGEQQQHQQQERKRRRVVAGDRSCQWSFALPRVPTSFPQQNRIGRG